MTEWATAIVVAVIGVVGAIMVALIQLFKKEVRNDTIDNRQDHAIVQQQLRMMFGTLTKVDSKLEKHLDQHKEGNNGTFTKGTQKYSD